MSIPDGTGVLLTIAGTVAAVVIAKWAGGADQALGSALPAAVVTRTT
jgi:hypothetical protein